MNNTTSSALQLLLVGNYAPDRQKSMRRFSKMLKDALKSRGITVELFQPPVILGRWVRHRTTLGKWIGYIDKYFFAPILLYRKLRKCSPTTFVHICDHSNAHFLVAAKSNSHLITCHDLLAVRSALDEFPQNQVGRTGKLQQALIRRYLKQAKAIVSVSNATRKDVQRVLGLHGASQQHVIPNALSPAFEQIKDSVDKPDCIPSGCDYILHIGSDSWYKNRTSMLRIYIALLEAKPSLHLIVVGPELNTSGLTNSIRERVEEQIHYLSDINDESLRQLYTHASLLLFPSLIEGFGWPIIEAQACGCPVFTLNREPMNELNASPQLLLNDELEQEADWEHKAAQKCAELLNQTPTSHAQHKEQLRQFTKQFGIQPVIDQYVALYQAELEKQK